MNVKVGFTSNEKPLSIETTVNYEVLLEIVKNNFTIPKYLLEEVVQSIESETKVRYPQISYLFVSIQKNNPPLSGEIEHSEVSLEKRYE